MNALYAFITVVILYLVVYLGVGRMGLETFFGVVIPYAAIVLFLLGFVFRIFGWARSTVPFRIPTTSGQQKSLSFIKNNNLESPHNTVGVIGRMALEILFFRSLFRNTKAEVKDNERLVYGPDKWLWAGALVFHWSFLVVFVRHYRFFAEPVPGFILGLQSLDGIFQIGVPVVYLTGAALLAGVTFLFLRRVVIPQVRYISLPADYFPLFVIMMIAGSGLLMRHFYKVDIVNVKELAMGLVSFAPSVPEGLGFIFYVHLFFVSVLFAYFPFSKLMHLGGVFLSPTRNLANTNRVKRHINPWNYDVKTHTYEEYEDEFRDVMREAGLPLDKEESVLPLEKE
ncbi:MAG: sulfate reduction electron transfer complex DsrMKJOP subunit DsrM [Candidatus Latescibacterota bacterium]|nr:MAG: sulfate reduction electron transfer complex DsrMKJOP subunit DsrM [Candidatus Latescibacterota bacterium]